MPTVWPERICGVTITACLIDINWVKIWQDTFNLDHEDLWLHSNPSTYGMMRSMRMILRREDRNIGELSVITLSSLFCITFGTQDKERYIVSGFSRTFHTACMEINARDGCSHGIPPGWKQELCLCCSKLLSPWKRSRPESKDGVTSTEHETSEVRKNEPTNEIFVVMVMVMIQMIILDRGLKYGMTTRQ